MKVLSQILMLLAVAALAGAVQGWIVGTEGSSIGKDPNSLGLLEAKAMADAIWVDARQEAAYVERHYGDAVHLNEDNWEAALGELLTRWEPGQTVIVYCDGIGCAASRNIAARLREELEIDQVFWLEDGWAALEEELP